MDDSSSSHRFGVIGEKHLEATKSLVTGRLRRSLENQDHSIRWLQRKLDERGAENSSYGAVHSYVTGKKMPSLEFLFAAADVLGLRRQWLLLGEGEPTPEQQRVRAEPEEELIERYANRFPAFAQLPREAQRLFVEVLADYILTAPDSGEAASGNGFPDVMEELAADLLWLLLLPVSSGESGSMWGFREFPAEMTERDRSQYAIAMLHALQCALAGKGEGDHMKNIERSRLRRMRQAFALLE